MTKNKKILGSVGVVLLVSVTIGIYFYCQNAEPDKVEQLQIDKIEKKESSGYDDCMAEVKKQQKEYDDKVVEQDKTVRVCIDDKLEALGYTDGFDCMKDSYKCFGKDEDDEDYEYSDEQVKRYNAEIQAEEDCRLIYPTIEMGIDMLTELDCIGLYYE